MAHNPSNRDGYPALSKWISRDPDHETFIFRRFKKLSARNLLHLQSQLIALEIRLEKLDEEIRQDDNLEVRQSLRRWESFVQRFGDPMTAGTGSGGLVNERVKLVIDLQNGLKEYQEALLLQSQVAHLEHPPARALSAFRAFFNGQKNSTSEPMLSGGAKHMLEDEHDLVALKVPAEKDLLSQFLQNHWPSQGSRSESEPDELFTYYLEKRVERMVAIINVIVAAILLIGAIMCLYCVTLPTARLCIMAVFTISFAVSIALFTNAKRAEVFAATAAYAAVLVVFVSGGLGSS